MDRQGERTRSNRKGAAGGQEQGKALPNLVESQHGKNDPTFGRFLAAEGEQRMNALCDSDGLWLQPQGEGLFIGVRFTDLAECLTESELRGTPRYSADVVMVDLSTIPQVVKDDAINSCGWEDMPTDSRTLAIVCVQYGAYAPLADYSGSNVRDVLRSARREAKRLLKSSNARQEALQKPVNKIGSTAQEFMVGDLHSAILRGLSEGNKNAELMAKLYGLQG